MTIDTILWTYLGREENLQSHPTSTYSIQSHLTRKLDQRIWATVELHLGRKPSKQYYPTVPSQQHPNAQSLGNGLIQLEIPIARPT